MAKPNTCDTLKTDFIYFLQFRRSVVHVSLTGSACGDMACTQRNKQNPKTWNLITCIKQNNLIELW